MKIELVNSTELPQSETSIGLTIGSQMMLSLTSQQNQLGWDYLSEQYGYSYFVLAYRHNFATGEKEPVYAASWWDVDGRI